jgi:hypothetical protein
MATSTRFWNEPDVEPKRKFRWVLSVGDGTIPAWVIKKVTKPTFTVSEVKHSFINHSFYYPGRVEYNEVEFTLVDPVDPDMASNILQIIMDSGYKLPETMDIAKQTITKGEAVASLNHCYIQQIASDASIIEQWDLTNAWVKEVNFGDLDYESDDINEITVKMRYDYAVKSV